MTITVEPIKFETREEWLAAAVEALRIRMTCIPAKVSAKCAAGVLPRIHVSIGFPKAGGSHSGGKAIGQCWPTPSSSDRRNHVFISPELSNPVEIISTLAHELCHVVDDCRNSHRGPFVKMVRAIGLVGKPTRTVAGPEFAAWAAELAYELGEFPSGSLSYATRKKQTTRMIKIQCSNADCGYTARTTAQWIKVGMPTCHCGSIFTAGGSAAGGFDEEMREAA